MCTGIWRVSNTSPNRDVNDRCDAVSISRGEYWKLLSAVQQLQSEGYPNELVLAGCKCEASFITFICSSHIARVEFCHWLFGNQQLHTKVLFTEEATFNRRGITNTRNSHVWSLDNPHAPMETHFHSHFPVNIWCSVIGSEVIWPFVLEEHLISERYFRFLEDELPLLLKIFLFTPGRGWGYSKMAHPLISEAGDCLSQSTFQIGCIRLQIPVAWPPRSPYLTPLDYCLWGRMKSAVYIVRWSTRAELLNHIMDASAHIRNDKPSLMRSSTAPSRRVTMYVDSQGDHFEQLLH